MNFFSCKVKDGFTLVEVLIALLIIALVILGGGMFFFYGRVSIIREARRRAAIMLVSERLEALKAADYSKIAADPAVVGYNPYYIVRSSSDWEVRTTETYEQVTVDDLDNQSMLTRARYVDDAGGSDYDYLELTVRVEWVDNTTNAVSATTLIAPQ